MLLLCATVYIFKLLKTELYLKKKQKQKQKQKPLWHSRLSSHVTTLRFY